MNQLLLPDWNRPEIGETLQHSSPSATGFVAVRDPFDFDNVGFTKSLAAGDAARHGLRYLSCAECDLAPLGVQDTRTAGNPILLARDRVKLE